MIETYELPASGYKAQYRAHGGSAELMACVEPEILFEGPANTGKTRTVLEKDNVLCDEFPGIRLLWVRKTRKSLSESVLTTWEEHVLPPGHPCITGTARKHNRDFYQYPNGSTIVLGGMDNPDRIMSTEYDGIRYFEATEGALDEWEKLSTRCRNKKIRMGTHPNGRPKFFHQMVADCNPGTADHWLNARAEEGNMHRIRTVHADNPVFDEDDQARLDRLTGVRRKRLRDGLWVSAEGQVWEEWDPATMMLYRRDLQWDAQDAEAGLWCNWYFGSIDWGFRNAGTLQIWGVDADDRMYLVHEVYKKRKRIDWWAGALERAMDKWELETVVADPSEPGDIEYLNDRVGELGGRDELPLVVKANNDRVMGREVVRDAMVDGRLFICHDAQEEGVCEHLKEEYKPTCLTRELSAYVWRETKNGQFDKEEPDPRCEDHGCDAMRYAATFKWGTNLDPFPTKKRFAPGSWGEALGHEETWTKIYTGKGDDVDDDFASLDDDDEQQDIEGRW